jgi:HAD superfamily hydrolase (TIGR01509 family)
MASRPIDLIIFDCDGVLVDSEPLAMRVLIAAIARQGVALDPLQAYRDYLGRSLASISESLEGSHGMPLGHEALESMRHDLYALYRQELRPNPGLPQMLAQLAMPFCVASSSQPERIRISLELTGLIPWFAPNVFSASMVEHGKPAPDLFLHAAATMGADPAGCLVVEDSPAGITAARAAGMRVFGYVGGSHIEPAGLRAAIEALAPDAVFDDMQTLPDLVGSRQTKKTAL